MTSEGEPLPGAGSPGSAKSWAERLYRRLLWATFPPGFLALYGNDALETFRDLCSAARARGRRAWLLTVLGAYLRALAGAFSERLESRRDHRRGRLRPIEERRLMLWQDVRFALRSFRHSPSFAFTVVALIGLGVGAVTTMFSVVDGVLLRPLPYPHAERLVYFTQGAHSLPKFGDWQEQATSFDRLVAARGDSAALLLAGGAPQEVRVTRVSPDFLETFGATALHGRLLGPGDFSDRGRVGVVDNRFWRDRLGADPAVVGSTLTLDDEPIVVVGVLTSRSRLPEALAPRSTALVLPLDRDDEFAGQRNLYVLRVAGRLSAGVELPAAQSELDAIAARLARAHPDFERDRATGEPRSTPLVPLQDATVGRVGRTLYLLLGAVGLLLLIACTNVASLSLARGTSRERELGLRSALGAGRRRLVTQLVTESVVLALGGGLLGVTLAYGAIRLFHLMRPSDLPRATEVAVDLRVLVASLLLSVLTGIAFGTLPALRAARFDAGAALRPTATTSGRSSRRLRSVLVVAEVALALVLLAGAGLLFHSFLRLQAVELGFDAEHLTVMRMERGGFGGEHAPPRRAFVRDVLERIRAVPGVEVAAASWIVPFLETGGSRCCWSFPARRTDQPEEEAQRVHVQPVTADYLRALDAPLLSGRQLRDSEPDAPTSVLASRSLVEELFPGRDPVDQILLSSGGELRIVGVVDDLKQWGLDQEPGRQIYVSYYDQGAGASLLSFVVRSSLPSEHLAERLREAVWAVDPRQPIHELISMSGLVSRSVATPRSLTLLWGAFAAISLILAAAGVYGCLLYSVGQRRRELGIRLALGARRSQVLELVVRQGIALAAAGIVLGVGVALYLGRLMEDLLFEVEAGDPLTLAAVAATLTMVAALACWLPARRAAATDPAETLRSE